MATKPELEEKVIKLEAELNRERYTNEIILEFLKVFTRTDLELEDLDKLEKKVIAGMLAQMNTLYNFDYSAYFRYDESSNSFIGNYAFGSRKRGELKKAWKPGPQMEPKELLEKSIENIKEIDFEVPLSDDSIFKRILTKRDSYLRGSVDYTAIDKRLGRKLGKPYVGIAIFGLRGDVIGIVYGNKSATKKPVSLTEEEVHASKYVKYPTATILELINAYRYIKEKSHYVNIGLSAVEFAHAVKNSIVQIGGYLPQLLRGVTSEKSFEGKDYDKKQIVLEECATVEKLVSMVMDFSQPSDPKPTEFDIADEIRKITEGLAGESKFEIKIEGDSRSVYADKHQLTVHTLTNMITNAFEAMRDPLTTAGYVRNKPNKFLINILYSTERCHVTMWNRQITDSDIVTVLNNGIMGKTTKKGKGGYGLGFAVALQKASLNYCELSIESYLKKGTFQRLSLPYKS